MKSGLTTHKLSEELDQQRGARQEKGCGYGKVIDSESIYWLLVRQGKTSNPSRSRKDRIRKSGTTKR